MKAIIQKAYGSPEVLELRDIVRPSHRPRPRRPRLLPVARAARTGRSAHPQPCAVWFTRPVTSEHMRERKGCARGE